MLVRDAMSKDPCYITPETSIKEAARMMQECDVGYLPVGENDRLTGILTDRDITIRATAEGRDPEKTKASDIMTEGVEYCFDDQSLEDAAKCLERSRIRRLVVLNRNKRLVGVLSVSDFATRNKDKKLVGVIEGGVCRKIA